MAVEVTGGGWSRRPSPLETEVTGPVPGTVGAVTRTEFDALADLVAAIIAGGYGGPRLVADETYPGFVTGYTTDDANPGFYLLTGLDPDPTYPGLYLIGT